MTVVFCDVVGSTTLGETTDPEALRALLARYFDRMREIVVRHGGSVEKFIGDAVMAVFGVPTVHEDDALRAVRAAEEMREALPRLGVQGRIGITTGEVVTGTAERLATGDAVNTAARLEQAAQPGEILLGEGAFRLLRGAVEVEALPPLALKGKAEPVAAYRVLAVVDGAPRRNEAPLVGRGRERQLLADAWERVRSERSCHLFTLLGPAGIGKSRLGAEFLASAADATVARGRCLPYGEGISYRPVIEVLQQLPDAEVDESAAATVRGLLGAEPLVASGDEIAWAVRKRLEQVAAGAPLICVFDDLHWAEETLLDLIDHVSDLSRDAPILLLCLARPDLLDRRPGWGGGKVNANSLLLEPLRPDEAALLVDSLSPVDENVRRRVVAAAEGNPLFVEEMVAMIRESPDGDVSVPPTIQALLAARLDQLDADEREVLQCGAVEGRVFHRGAVQTLAPGNARIPALLTALVRKELVRPDKPQVPGEDAFRFRHLLFREAAYEALPKTTRAELHTTFAAWLSERGSELVEQDEILGYHLERAARYRDELGLPPDGEVACAARRRLAAAGRRALMRHDFAAAHNLLGRAVALVPPGESDVALEVDAIEALRYADSAEDAYRAADVAIERAKAAGDPTGELCLRLVQGIVRVHVDPEGATAQLAALVDRALPAFQAADDTFALQVVHSARGLLAHHAARYDAELEAVEQALLYARRAGLQHIEADLEAPLAASRLFGGTSAAAVLAWLDEREASGVRNSRLRSIRSLALAMVGRFDEARALVSELRTEYAERGATGRLATLTAQVAAEVELLAGDPAAAAELGEKGCRLLERVGDQAVLSTAAALLAQALYELGRLEEADAWARRAAELGATDDAATQILWRRAKAKVLARREEFDEAERLARDAVALGAGTDKIDWQGGSYVDLSEVLCLAGRRTEAAAALEQALSLFERKGNLVMAGRVRDRLRELSSPGAPV